MNLSKYYGKTVPPSCAYCLFVRREGEALVCEKGKEAAEGASCRAYRYEPTLRVPKEAPLLPQYAPEDFQL